MRKDLAGIFLVIIILSILGYFGVSAYFNKINELKEEIDLNTPISSSISKSIQFDKLVEVLKEDSIDSNIDIVYIDNSDSISFKFDNEQIFLVKDQNTGTLYVRSINSSNYNGTDGNYLYSYSLDDKTNYKYVSGYVLACIEDYRKNISEY